MAKVVQGSAHSCSEPEQATCFLINTGFLEAVTQQHQQPRLLPKKALPFLRYCWSIWTGMLHDCHINLQDWQDVELARIVQCSAHSCSELEQANWFLVATGFLEAVTEQHQEPKSSQNKLSAFKIVKEPLFIDLISGEDGNWEENGSLTVFTGWHLHVCVCSLFGQTGRTLN